VAARLAGHSRRQRGGVRPWQAFRDDILRHLKQDRSLLNALIVDYYGMPHDWPQRTEAAMLPTPHEKASLIETALCRELASAMGAGFDTNRFTPLVMMHEFEALLFSDPIGLANAMGKPQLAPALSSIRAQFPSPEQINDSPQTAPSKRIEQLFPGYQKVLVGTAAAHQIGLPKICQECRHFASWIESLESRAA